MNQTTKIYLDETKLFGMQQTEPEDKVPVINVDAVEWYTDYFQKMMGHYTLQISLNNGIDYFVFSKVPAKEWVDIAKTRNTIQATRYLDTIEMESIIVHSVLSIRDVTDEVRNQYRLQKELIFNSYELVKKIMKHSDTKFVQEMIGYVLDSRTNDESKRKFWRVVNEKYYGLDIHPLMEYEEAELQKILYYCEHPEEQKILKWKPIIRSGSITAGGVLAGWLTYMFLFN